MPAHTPAPSDPVVSACSRNARHPGSHALTDGSGLSSACARLSEAIRTSSAASAIVATKCTAVTRRPGKRLILNAPARPPLRADEIMQAQSRVCYGSHLPILVTARSDGASFFFDEENCPL